jgi:hypothetical protein
MSALWLQMRSTPARWAVVPLTAAAVAFLFGRDRFWIGIWPESGAAAQVSAFFLSIFAAGVTAFIASSVEVRGLVDQERSAAIRPLLIELHRFGAAFIWLFLPYVAVGAVAFVVTATRDFPPGVAGFFSYLLLGVVVMVFGAASGWLVGRLLPPLIAAVCAALGWFILLSVVGDSSGATPVSGPPWYEVRLGVVALRLAAVALLALVVCALPSKADERNNRFAYRLVASVIALGLAVIVHSSTTVRVHRAPVAKPLCVQATIQYCLWPEHVKYVPLIKTVDAQVAALPGHLPLPARVVDYALSGRIKWINEYDAIDLPGDFPPEFEISDGSRWGLARGVASAIVSSVFADCSPDAPEDPQQRRDELLAWIEWRLAGGGTPDYRTDAPQALQAAWAVGRNVAAHGSEQEQTAWLTELTSTVKKNYCRAA